MAMKQITKSLLTMGGIAAVALAIAFAAAWVGRDEEQKQEAKEKSEKLFEFDKTTARELKLSKAGALIAEFKRADEKSAWALSAPVATPADEAAVGAILDKLSTLKQKSEVEGMDAKQAGLADESKAAIAVQVIDAAGKPIGLFFGEENPFDQTIYVKKAGETLLRLVPKADKAPFDKTLFDLRDKLVAHVDSTSGLTKVQVTPDAAALKTELGNNAAGTFAYEFERDGANWKLDAPVAGLADSGAIDRLVASIKNLRAKSVASETSDDVTLAKYGLAFPKLAVTATVAPIGGKESFVRKLLIGQPALAGGAVSIKTYAKRDDAPTIYEVDGQIVKDLTHDLFELQDKTVMKIDREAVRRIEYANPGQETLVVTRSKEPLPDGGAGEEKFAMTAPKQGPVKKFKLSGNLYALANLKAAAFGEVKPADAKGLAKFGLDKPRTITLFGDKDAVLGRVLLGAETTDKADPKKQRRFAWVEGGARIVELEKNVVDELPQKAEDILEPPPVPAAPATPNAALQSAPAPFTPASGPAAGGSK